MAQQNHFEEFAGREATARERTHTDSLDRDGALDDNDVTDTFPIITDADLVAAPVSDYSFDEWQVGDVVDGRFVVQQRLGTGIYGPLFKALDRALSEPQLGVEHYVVLEELPPWVAERATFIERLEQLRLYPQSWSHPNIAKVLGFGRDGERYFSCEEWLEGASLRAVLEASAPDALEEHEVLAVLRYVGDALSYAHAKGIVHGNLRPDNVFVTDAYELKLTGFLPSIEPRAEAVFVEDPSAGGQPHTSDDVYGLACLAYELLTRRHPYRGKTPLEALRAGLTAIPPPALSPERWQALSRGLALRRARRTATIAELLHELGVTGDETLRPAREDSETAAPPLDAARAETELWPTITPPAPARSSPDFAASPAAETPMSEHFALEMSPDRLGEIYPEPPARLARRRRGRRRSSLVRTLLGLVVAAGLAAYAYLNQSFLRERAADLMETATALVLSRTERPARAPTSEPSAAPTASQPSAAPRVAEPPVAAPAAEPVAAPAVTEPPATAAELPVASAAVEPAPPAPPESASATEPESVPAASAPAPADLPAPTSAAPQPPAAAAVVGPMRFSFVERMLTVNESDGSARILIRRSGSLDEEANVVWWTTDGTATGDEDYAVLGARIARFAAGQDTQVFYVPLIADSRPEPRENFFVHLRSERAGGTAMELEVVVLDDDR